MPILLGVKRKPDSRKPTHHKPAPRIVTDTVPLEMTVEKLVPGGDGLARHEGKVVFVPGSLPGERIRARLTESKKDFARAEILEILAPSPDRTTPPCPLAGRCGGCDWQHISYAAQLRQKLAMAADALKRIGGMEWPDLAIEAGEPWRYRNRAQLHRAPGGGLGFLGRGSHDVIPVPSCPVADPALDALLTSSPAVPDSGEPASRGATERFMAWGYSHGAGSLGALAPMGSARGRGSEDEAALEGREIAVDILGKTIRFDLRCFFQSNAAMVEKLLPYALEGLAGKRAMDLYCGVGLFGAFLADRFRSVLAVEENAAALAYARKNIPGTGNVFLEGRLEDLVLQGRLGDSGEAPEAVIVDPPRPGLDQAVRDWLIETKPPRLVYVSCNPVTLARDLKSLIGSGFVLKDLRLFDFYPQTAHVEAVAKLEPGN